jgi:hypothetical protein
MDFVSAALSPSVICSACITLAATTAWRWVIDWRRARAIGYTVSELREGRKIWVRWTLKLRRNRVESSARVSVLALCDSAAASDESAVPAITSQQSEAPPSLSETVENAPKTKPRAESSIGKPRCPARVIVGAADQMRDFLAYELARKTGPRIKREFCDWYQSYLRWADIHSIDALPQSIFLKLLGKSAGVEKKIERLKDPRTGRVVKNDAGTPVRVYSYILGDDEDAPASSSKKPRETRAQKMAREMREIAERRQVAASMPQRTWAEELASMAHETRVEHGLELPQRVAA